MILSAQSIFKRVGMIEPFCERTTEFGMTFGLSPAGYDIRIAQAAAVEPMGFVLASSLEKFDIPNDILARVTDKSTWARLGLCVQNTVIEPGWRGHLTLELTNHAKHDIFIHKGMPIAQVLFELLDEPTNQPYVGKYQDQPNEIVEPILERM